MKGQNNMQHVECFGTSKYSFQAASESVINLERRRLRCVVPARGEIESGSHVVAMPLEIYVY